MSETEILGKILKKLESTEDTLGEIFKWIRFANFGKLKETLEAELDTNEKRIAYDNSDGACGLKELAALSDASQDTIYLWWQKWFRLGLVTESQIRKGRLKKIVSLGDLGLKATKGKGARANYKMPKNSSKER